MINLNNIFEMLNYKVTDEKLHWKIALCLGAIYALTYFSFMFLPIAEFFYNPASDNYLHKVILYRMQGGILDVRDTQSYIEFFTVRTAFYPVLLKIFSSIGFSFFYITVLQLLLFALAFTLLLFHLLRMRLTLSLILAFYVLITFNVYFNQFHFVILTESLCISVICLLAIALMNYMKYFQIRYLILCGFLAGILCGIRPAMYPFGLGIIITVACLHWRKMPWQQQLKTLSLGIIAPIIAMLLLENVIFYSYHDNRETLTIRHFVGKAAMITQMPGFNINKIPTTEHEIIDEWDVLIAERRIEIKKTTNNRLNYWTNLEANTYGLYGDVTKNKAKRSINGKNSTTKLRVARKKVQKNMFTLILTTHPLQYIQLTLINYVALFNASGILFYPFILFGIFYLLASLYCALRFCICVFKPQAVTLSNHEIFAMNLLLWVNGYNLFVAMTTVGLSRFLMLAYPIMLLGILIIAWDIANRLYQKIKPT